LPAQSTLYYEKGDEWMDTVFLVRKAQKGSDEAFEELLSGV
jgi:hypothetical protein